MGKNLNANHSLVGNLPDEVKYIENFDKIFSLVNKDCFPIEKCFMVPVYDYYFAEFRENKLFNLWGGDKRSEFDKTLGGNGELNKTEPNEFNLVIRLVREGAIIRKVKPVWKYETF